MEDKKSIDLIKEADSKQKKEVLKHVTAKLKKWQHERNFNRYLMKQLLSEAGVAADEVNDVLKYVRAQSGLTEQDKRRAEDKAQRFARDFRDDCDPLA